MSPLTILLSVSAAGVLGAASLAGAFALRSGPATSGEDAAALAMPSFSAPEAAPLSQAWDKLAASGSSLATDSAALTRRWQAFDAALKKIYPQAKEVTDASSATAALKDATAWLEERMKAAADTRNSAAELAATDVLAEIATLRADLEALDAYRKQPLSGRLTNLLILGDNRSAANGVELVWIPDSSKGADGGFWAARTETTAVQFRAMVGTEPASMFQKPAAGKVSDAEVDRMLQEARTKFLANAPAANREAAALTFDERMAPRLRSQYRTAAEQRAQQAAGNYDKFPAPLANLSVKDDTAPFLSKLQQIDLPASTWKYRLPTKSEWALLNGKVEGIGTPDLSEWLADSNTAVDKNWKADQASSPPEPGTVGFRAVLSGVSP